MLSVQESSKNFRVLNNAFGLASCILETSTYIFPEAKNISKYGETKSMQVHILKYYAATYGSSNTEKYHPLVFTKYNTSI